MLPARNTSRHVIDRVARLHLRNSARLELLNSLGNTSPMS
ncbi:malonyl-CoA decarboxylase domain-containing protein [Cypionkella sp. TWP1-2-1b2]